MDRISQLPEGIVHHILSFLSTSPAELVRMSVLSKTWFHLTASFPTLDFWMYTFKHDLRLSPESFFKYVEYTTSRFCHHNVPAHKFNLIATLQMPAEFDVVNRCLELLLKNGVRELKIDIINLPSLPKYHLPNTLLSVSVLRSLTIRGCDLPSSLMLDVVKFNSLIQLSLQNVHIDDEVIKHLATCCPLLQELRITTCHGFKTFCVYGHQNLQKLRFLYNTPIEIIDIEAPNLSLLSVVDMDQRGPPRMNLASCKKLTTVAYNGNLLPNSNFLSNFPFLEIFCLLTEYKCSNLKLSSNSLKMLVLHSNCDLEDVEFSIPSLVLFVYASYYHLLPPLLRNSPRFKECMQCYLDGSIDTLWLFHKLRRFLDKKTGFKVLNLYIHAINSQKFTKLEKLKAIELPPYELDHVELQLDTHEEPSDHAAFLDALLWCCRPRSLTLRSSFPLTDFEDIVKFTYKKLLEQEDQGHTNIQIMSPSEAQKHCIDLKSLSIALPRGGQTIHFIKEEDSCPRRKW